MLNFVVTTNWRTFHGFIDKKHIWIDDWVNVCFFITNVYESRSFLATYLNITFFCWKRFRTVIPCSVRGVSGRWLWIIIKMWVMKRIASTSQSKCAFYAFLWSIHFFIFTRTSKNTNLHLTSCYFFFTKRW